MTKFGRATQIIGAMVIGLGSMGVAQANISCGGGGGNTQPCPSWTFNKSGTITGNAATLRISESQQNSLAPGVTTVTATAYSNLGRTNSLLQQGYIGAYGEMGVTDSLNRTGGLPTTPDSSDFYAPNHAVDNSGNTDSILFSFASDKVNLTSFTTGYERYDADFTVLAYTGSGIPDLSALSYGDTASGTGLLQNGWTLIANTNVGGAANNGTTHTFANNVASSYWLIGALNSFVGGTTAGNDYFKILSVAGCDCSTAPPGTVGCGGTTSHGTPEPGTLFLMGAGLFGLTRIKARRTAISAA
jgi:hypothetical protein